MLRFTIAIALIAISTLNAGEYNKAISCGDKGYAFADLPGVDGKKHSLADFKDKDVVVIVFTCNSCPIAVGYEDRLIAFTKKYAAKAAVVAINVNTIEADRLDKMQERAKEKGFNFAYLYDETQKTAKEYGANYTPEFFVLDKERKIAYMGAMDDKSTAGAAKEQFLEQAVEAVLAGKKPEKGETLARGCAIRYARAKR